MKSFNDCNVAQRLLTVSKLCRLNDVYAIVAGTHTEDRQWLVDTSRSRTLFGTAAGIERFDDVIVRLMHYIAGDPELQYDLVEDSDGGMHVFLS